MRVRAAAVRRPSVRRPRGALPEQEGKEEGDTVENFRQIKE